MGKHSRPGGCLGVLAAAGAVALVTAGAVLTPAAARAVPRPIPGCAGGADVVVSDYANWGLYDSGIPPNLWIAGGTTQSIVCATAVGAWQEIHDLNSGECMGVNGLANVYEKPCNGRAFELWTSGSSPVGALLLQNDWVNINYSCPPGDGVPVLSAISDGAPVQMRCAPIGQGYQLNQKWNWYRAP
jgi:hypothetical protein